MGTPVTITRTRASRRNAAFLSAAVLLVAGCSSMNDTSENFVKSIDKYYSAHPSCVFPEPAKFPIQATTQKEISGLDSLVYQGLLVRTSDQKKAMPDGAQQATDYSLSSKGQSVWVADTRQPGFGNFCYGTRKVSSIDSSTPTTSKNGATTDVVYRYSITGAPEWAKAPEVQTAFPGLRADLAGNQVGRATLTDSRKGWQVTSAPWAHISDSDIYK